MAKEFDVTIVETLRKKVTVEADSLEEAEQLVNDRWYAGDYILDADDFFGVEFESAEPVIDLSYREMSDVFRHVNDKHKEPVCGYIVFSPDSFDKSYSEQSRTYMVSSNNKACLACSVLCCWCCKNLRLTYGSKETRTRLKAVYPFCACKGRNHLWA